MDISRFSDADFDVKKWVNDSLRAHKETNTPIDAHASTLVMKLQLFIQEVNNSLEETGGGVVQSLPRVLRDIEAVRQEALLLKEQMSVVKEDIKRVESETSISMQRLVDLDAVKTRMQNSKKALQEADNWESLVVDVEDVFATQDIDKIADKVTRMEQSLKVLHDVPDYEERRKLLESLKNKVEAMISPKLIAAFNDHVISDAQKYVGIFNNIARKQRVNEYYVQCHKNTIQQLWSTLQSSESSLQNNLSTFYNQLLIKWSSEYTWCSQVFTSPLGMLGKVFGESLHNLTPPLSQVLHTCVHRSSRPVQTLIELRNIMLNFLKVFSNSLQLTDSSSVIYPLVEIFHLPFCQLLVQYGSLQQQELMNKLCTINNLIINNIEEMLIGVSQSVSAVISTASVAMENCVQLTSGWGFTAFIKSVETYFIQFIKKLSLVLQDLRTKCDVPIEETDTNTAKNGSQDEWTHLQFIFQLTQCYGDFLLRTKSLNSQICHQIINCREWFNNPAGPGNPFGVFDYLCIYHPEEHTAVTELLAAVEKSGDDHVILLGTTNQIKALIEGTHVLAFDIIFAQLKKKLSGIPKLKVWEKRVSSPLSSPRALVDDLPSFSLSPLPYITEIGDHLLTLPQQLEPFMSHDNPALMAALKLAKLPYMDSTSSSDRDEELNPSDMWLDAIARGTMETYVENILLIPRLTDAAAQQLATDIGYLCNVLAAIDQNPITALTALEKLLKTDREGFSNFKDDKHTDRIMYQKLSKLRTWD